MSAGAVAAVIAVLILTIAVPLGTMLCLRRRGGTWGAFLVGAGTFLLFALVLEPVLHRLVLGSGIGPAIQGNIWLYGLYGGLAAGLFEETGRLLAFRYFLKSRPARVTALSYGIGHGGIEAFVLAGLTMLSNLILGLSYSSGSALPPEAASAAAAVVSTPAHLFLLGGFERLCAMSLHMALSVLVFASLRLENRRRLFPAAILAHGAVDFAAVVSAGFLPAAAVEGIVLLMTVLVCAWAAQIYKKLT